MSHHQMKWQKMVICGRPPQADDTFVAMDALAENVCVEDFTANRIVTAKSFSCVFDPTYCFFFSVFYFSATSLASEFANDLPQ